MNKSRHVENSHLGKDIFIKKITKELSGLDLLPTDEERMIQTVTKICEDYLSKYIHKVVTEIRAGNILVPIFNEQDVWNRANRRAIDIIESYKPGK